MLTWPDGLNTLIMRMSATIDRRQPSAPAWHAGGFAVRISERAGGIDILCADPVEGALRSFVIRCRRAICAMPLFVAVRACSQLGELGFDAQAHLPSYAPWMVSNFLMRRFPREHEGAALAWDNIVCNGSGLGYVVSTHQDIRVARPRQTVFSAYHALSDRTPQDARRWLTTATPNELFDVAASDLAHVYGLRFPLHVQALDVTVRGHAMATPLPGFLTNAGIASLREADGRLLFAHSDLSGYSVFEEAAWWGCRAAQKVLGSA